MIRFADAYLESSSRTSGGGDAKENLCGLCGSRHDDNPEDRIDVTAGAGTRLTFDLRIRNVVPLEIYVTKE